MNKREQSRMRMICIKRGNKKLIPLDMNTLNFIEDNFTYSLTNKRDNNNNVFDILTYNIDNIDDILPKNFYNIRYQKYIHIITDRPFFTYTDYGIKYDVDILRFYLKVDFNKHNYSLLDLFQIYMNICEMVKITPKQIFTREGLIDCIKQDIKEEFADYDCIY